MTGSVDAPTEEDAEEEFQWSHWTDTTFLLLNLTSLVEAADLTVLPSVFQEISLEFDVTPAQLVPTQIPHGRNLEEEEKGV